MNERMIKKAYGNVIDSTPLKKINVIISAYDSAEFLQDCLDSIESQTYKPNRILLGIDGCKKTLDKALEIAKKYSNLEIYYAEENRGPYQMFNSLAELVSDDEYIQRFDSDDIMYSNLLEEMSKYNVPTVSRHDGILFLKKEVLNLVGGFRDWKCAADSDMVFRLQKALGNKVLRIPKYYVRRTHDKQLTKKAETCIGSKLRLGYIDIYSENVNSINPDVYIKPVCNYIIRILF